MAESPTKQALDELGIGARLRSLRGESGLSQRALAERAGVSSVTVSLIEQGKHAPSVITLHRILSALSIGLADFFDNVGAPEGVTVVEEADLREIVRGSVTVRLLPTGPRGGTLQLFHETYEPAATTGPGFLTHTGETLGLVVAGTISVESAQDAQNVTEGGGFRIPANTPYRLNNPSPTVAIVICACTPPM